MELCPALPTLFLTIRKLCVLFQNVCEVEEASETTNMPARQMLCGCICSFGVFCLKHVDTIQSHAKLLSVNAYIHAEQKFYMANVVLNSDN